MKKFKVEVEGSFLKEYEIEAESMNDAQECAVQKMNKEIGLMPDDYVISSVLTESVI